MSLSRSGWPVRPSGHTGSRLLSSTSLQHMNVNTSRCYSEIVGMHTQHNHLQFPSLSSLRYFSFHLAWVGLYCYSIDRMIGLCNTHSFSPSHAVDSVNGRRRFRCRRRVPWKVQPYTCPLTSSPIADFPSLSPDGHTS